MTGNCKNHNLVVIYYTSKLLSCLKNSFTLTKAPCYICIIVPYFSYYISFITVSPVILTNQFMPVIPGHAIQVILVIPVTLVI